MEELQASESLCTQKDNCGVSGRRTGNLVSSDAQCNLDTTFEWSRTNTGNPVGTPRTFPHVTRQGNVYTRGTINLVLDSHSRRVE